MRGAIACALWSVPACSSFPDLPAANDAQAAPDAPLPSGQALHVAAPK